MSELNGPKKKARRSSIDGMISPPRRQIGTPTYYRGKSQTPGFSPAQASRRRPHQANERSLINKEAPQLGDFDQPEAQSTFHEPSSRSIDSAPAPKVAKKKHKPGHLRTWWKNRGWKFKTALVMLVIMLGLGGAFGFRLYSFLHSVFSKGVGNSNSAALQKKVNPGSLNTEGDGRLNVLMLGRGGQENEAPDLTDTMLIASIDLETQSAALLSIPRDTWVSVNGQGMKINATYSTTKMQAKYKGKSDSEAETAAIQATITQARNVAGVPIHKYVLADYKAFRDIVNALGGVNINVDKPIYDSFTGWSFKAGSQTFNGDRALQYARSRHGSARGDFDRTEHQRQLLIAMRDKASSTGILANPVRLNSLANAVQKNMRTDLSIDEARTVYDRTKLMTDDKILSLDLAKPDNPLVTTGMISGQSIVRPIAGLSDFSKIRAYARSNMLDPFLKKETPTVAVYNASGKAGLATQVGDVLSSYGYKVLLKESAKMTTKQTVVAKQSSEDKPYTNRFLNIRFNTTLVSSVPDGLIPDQTSTSSTTNQAEKPQFIIVLGTDFSYPSGPTW